MQGGLVATGGVWTTSVASWPVDSKTKYRVKMVVEMLENPDSKTFYAGVRSYDSEDNHLSTDTCTSYNYGVASGNNLSPGVHEFDVDFTGFNSEGACESHRRFDPGAVFFRLVFGAFYPGGDDTHSMVIRELMVTAST